MAECGNCGMPEWFCDAKHFWVPVFKGIATGFLIGGSIGAFLAALTWI